MKRSAFKRAVVATVITTMLSQFAAPLCAYALTGGPAQPEFSKFEPVGTTDMVNTFSGDFTYNLPVLSIPGPDGSGYALSLSYHSGESGEDESSWVGKGWTLNPGAINRNRRGFPDDYKGQNIFHYNHVETNWTVSAGPRLGVEAFSKELGLSLSMTANYNNYRGYTHTTSYGLSVMGVLDLGYNVTNGDGSWSVAVNPAAILRRVHDAVAGPEKVDPKMLEEYHISEDEFTRSGQTMPHGAQFGAASLSSIAHFALGLFAEQVQPTYFPVYTGRSYQFHVGAEIDACLPVGFEAGYRASYTYQDNLDENTPAYGYMYSADAPATAQMDYYVEKEGAFNKRDRYLGIPFSNADQFIVSGEGVGGSFRLHNRNVGQFHPATKQSSTKTIQLGVDGHIGEVVGIGSTLNLSEHTLDLSEWSAPNNYRFARADKGDDSVFFRFTSDLGGSVVAGNDTPERATAGRPYSVASDIAKYINNGSRAGRSSYIGYSTIAEMRDHPLFECYGAPGPSYMKAYNKADSSRRFVDYSDASIQDGIGEFAVTTPNGERRVYGLPVYSRNEYDLNYVVDGATSKDGYLVYKQRTPTDGGYTVGERRDAPYATTYLLTEITTSEYVDRTNDGPTSDDLGGYTKFNYTRTAGSNTKSAGGGWYKWRIPYCGLQYHRNSLSDGRDDIGSAAFGEKEIYYLSSIETKTHIAKFITSSRHDGYEADHGDGNAVDHGESDASSDSTSTGVDPGNNKLQKLDRIELYAKNPDGTIGKKLSVVHFEYDSSLCANLPNAENNPDGSLNTDGSRKHLGHLTLKRVYFEYEGVVNARTSPYVFGYEYKKAADYSALSSSIQSTYAAILNHGSSFTSSDQNPEYSPFAVDPWGSYRYDGATRALNYEPWVTQKEQPDFDPAAWQLKWIQLPSGGEIHIQYEQKDYRYVQNRTPMVMAKLHSVGGSDNGGGQDHYYIDLADFDLTASDVSRVVKAINNMAASSERFYFKFLYALSGSQANLTNCSSEFITGYIKVKSAEAIGSSTAIKINLENTDDGYQHPRDIARNFVQTNRAGIIDTYGACDPRVAAIRHDEQDAWDEVGKLIGAFGETFFTSGDACNYIDLSHSYIRIPFPYAKKGGGIRVKRLLMYDKGIESGAAALYGTEYSYTLEDGATSSGVATNEPPTAREGNPLVTYIQKRDEQNWINRALSGDDKEQFEAPFGESVLPPASVGYSRVVARNIHTGKTATGYTIDEFYTTYDYPFDKIYNADGLKKPSATVTDLDASDVPVIFTNGVATVCNYNMARTQGYRFVLNDMNGQPKRVAQYGGDPTDGSGNDILVAEQAYNYFQPGEPVPMIHQFGTTPVMENPGKEMEIVMEGRKVDDFTVSGGLAGDITVTFCLLFPVIIPSAFPTVDVDEETLQTHVTTKVIRYPAIVKSTRIFRDGVQHVSENVGFDPESGRPVLMKTSDGYDNLLLGGSSSPHPGAYYQAAIPAWQPYPDLGQLAERERLVIKANTDLSIEKRYKTEHTLNFLFKSRGAVGRSIQMLTPGDLVRILGSGDSPTYYGTYYVGAIAGNQVQLLPTYISNVNTDAEVDVGTIEVIRSARTNQTAVDAGSVSTYSTMPSYTDHPLP